MTPEFIFYSELLSFVLISDGEIQQADMSSQGKGQTKVGKYKSKKRPGYVCYFFFFTYFKFWLNERDQKPKVVWKHDTLDTVAVEGNSNFT